jgi:hypothetical protein
MAIKSILCLGENGGSHTHIFYTVDNICRYVHGKSESSVDCVVISL